MLSPSGKLPALFAAIGPFGREHVAHLRRFLLIGRAFEEGNVTSFKKAHAYCRSRASDWKTDRRLMGCRETFRKSATSCEDIFSDFFGGPVQLFVRLGEGMGWLGFTERGREALALAREFIDYCDDVSRRRGGSDADRRK